MKTWFIFGGIFRNGDFSRNGAQHRILCGPFSDTATSGKSRERADYEKYRYMLV